MAAGNAVLRPVLDPAGYKLAPTDNGRGSGGTFAVARWERGTQYIELHFRWALGIVRYGWGAEAFDHAHILGALGCTEAAYPGFSNDPTDGFRHLAVDLAGPLAELIGPTNGRVLELARVYEPPPRVLP